MTKKSRLFRKWLWDKDWIAQPIKPNLYSPREYREQVRKFKHWSKIKEEGEDDDE